MTAFGDPFGMLVLVGFETDRTLGRNFRVDRIRILLDLFPSIFEHLSDLVDVLLTHGIEGSLELLHVV
jgi:hypothetical protein